MQISRVFISYSRESKEHQEWVASLADALQRESDIKVEFDQYELYAGKDLTEFMERAARADRVVVILTPEYARRANERNGGVGYESNILSARLFHDTLDDTFIPVLRGDPETSIPSYLKSKLYEDMRERSPHDVGELLRAIRREPSRLRPTSHGNRVLPPAKDVTAWLEEFSGMVKIADVHCDPLRIEIGGTVAMHYTIVNNMGADIRVWLGASVLPEASGDEYYNVEQDKRVVLLPGEGRYSRDLTIPPRALPGSYRVVCAVYLEQLGDMRLDRIDLGYILAVC